MRSLCNQSPNRFASLESCRRNCEAESKPAQRCFKKAVFTACGRRDIRSSWWFFDGHSCRIWNFPGGDCPVDGPRMLFQSRADCITALP
ncbi:uncharacterized protein LOC144148264 [Haemaphysalis longicornis]